MNELQDKPLTTKRLLFTTFFVDAFNLVLNVVVAVLTGSVIMLSAALQSLAELSSAVMFMLGKKYTNRRPTKLHPFGFGKEIYYWTTLAAFVIMGLTAMLAVNFGYKDFSHATGVNHILIACIALAVGLGANSYSFAVSARKLLDGRPFLDLPKAFVASPMIGAKTTVVLDIMGVVGSALGILFLVSQRLTGNLKFDGAGAIAMGVVLAVFALALLVSVRTLVTGQSAPPEIERRIRDAARGVPEVKHVLGLRTMTLGTDRLMVDIDVHLRDGLTTDQVEETVQRVKQAIEATGEGLRVHVEPDPYHDVHKPHDLQA